MTILSWVAGFQIRTGWHFLSPAESVRLSRTVSGPGRRPLRAIASKRGGTDMVCLDAAERDPRKARVYIVRGAGRRAQVTEEHASLADWVRALGLTSARGGAGAHAGY